MDFNQVQLHEGATGVVTQSPKLRSVHICPTVIILKCLIMLSLILCFAHEVLRNNELGALAPQQPSENRFPAPVHSPASWCPGSHLASPLRLLQTDQCAPIFCHPKPCPAFSSWLSPSNRCCSTASRALCTAADSEQDMCIRWSVAGGTKKSGNLWGHVLS